MSAHMGLGRGVLHLTEEQRARRNAALARKTIVSEHSTASLPRTSRPIGVSNASKQAPARPESQLIHKPTGYRMPETDNRRERRPRRQSEDRPYRESLAEHVSPSMLNKLRSRFT